MLSVKHCKDTLKMRLFMLLFSLVIYIQCEEVEPTITVRKFVYQKDMSEYCRRRVMPSVFIGRQVVEANSQILHFSQLDVPYSCFISIRTESGGSIILVIQTALEDDGVICKKHEESPVKVFEMGETFGGYWGPLPDSVIKGTMSTQEQYYTLKTTTVKPESEDSEIEDEIFVPKTIRPLINDKGHLAGEEYYQVEFPIVNITGHLVPSNKSEQESDTSLDAFDRFYEVQLRPGESYTSTIFPLLQFSVAEDQGGPRRVGDTADKDNVTRADAATGEMRYQIDYDFGAFTFDPRLNFPFDDDKVVNPGRRYPALANRKFNFKKKQKGKFFSAVDTPTYSHRTEPTTRSNNRLSNIEALFANLTRNNQEQEEQENQSESERFSALLQRVADWQYNYSAYLAPNVSLNDPFSFDKSSQASIGFSTSFPPKRTMSYKLNTHHVNKPSSTWIFPSKVTTAKMSSPSQHTGSESTSTVTSTQHTGMIASTTEKIMDVSRDITSKVTQIATSSINKMTELTSGFAVKYLSLDTTANVKDVNQTMVTGSQTMVTGSKISNDTLNKTTASPKTTQSHQRAFKGLAIKSTVTPTTPVTGSVADRASWDNVVKVAPVIADRLNQTLATTKSVGGTKRPPVADRGKRRRRRRKKRSIQAIPIDGARPHNLTTESDVVTTPEAMYNFVDMQDFAQLVELQDDEIQGHLALRYMRRYVGATLFDLCSDKNKSQTQIVYLFNTSRIVLALNNFTLKRMTVVATPARWMALTEQRCHERDLECQISGARVCVSQLTACDGVPNCGAYDIYDEDRLLCGAAIGLQHNVYLAAFTFLAVLLTLLYTVHYWLKRCVPKVSEAFFIYTNGTENILYLETIMRSPLESGDVKETTRGHYLEDVLQLLEESQPKQKSIFKRMFACSKCCTRKQKKVDDYEMSDMDLDFRTRSKLFSFPELEISNLQHAQAVEASVQTGDSLEMNYVQQKIHERIAAGRLDDPHRNRTESIDPRAALRDIRIITSDEQHSRRATEESELSMLKFLREAKMSAEHWNPPEQIYTPVPSPHRVDQGREMELRSTLYDHSALTVSSMSPDSLLPMSFPIFESRIEKTPLDLNIHVPSASGLAPKRLRFNENLTSIPQEELNVQEVFEPAPVPLVEPCPSGSSGRDFRRFWTNKTKDKGKKPKKKSHLPMH